MAFLRGERTRLVSAVVLSFALGVISASGVGALMGAGPNAPVSSTVTQAGLVGDLPRAGDVQRLQAPPTDPAVVTVPAEEASLTLDERRARWFALVYEGRNFDVVDGPARHPEP
jgi:hypothetical protein